MIKARFSPLTLRVLPFFLNHRRNLLTFFFLVYNGIYIYEIMVPPMVPYGTTNNSVTLTVVKHGIKL